MQAKPSGCLVLLSVVADTAAIMQEVRVARAQAARRIILHPPEYRYIRCSRRLKPVVAGHTAKGSLPCLDSVPFSFHGRDQLYQRYLNWSLGAVRMRQAPPQAGTTTGVRTEVPCVATSTSHLTNFWRMSLYFFSHSIAVVYLSLSCWLTSSTSSNTPRFQLRIPHCQTPYTLPWTLTE